MTFHCLWLRKDAKPALWQGRDGKNRTVLLFQSEQSAVEYLKDKNIQGWSVGKLDVVAVLELIQRFGDGKSYWLYQENGTYAPYSLLALSQHAPRYGMTQESFTPEEMELAREAWAKIGHYVDRTWEEFERKCLSEARVTYQLRVWVCCARAWEKYFAKHPQSKSEHAREMVARLMLAISLDAQSRKKPKQWDELVSLYRETAEEMGLPPSSPAELVKALPLSWQ